MKNIKRIGEMVVKSVLSLSGAITTIAIVLIVLFLFKEGFGLFGSPTIEKGYALFVNASNEVKTLNAEQVKQIFDEQITSWKDVGGKDDEIMLFRFEEIFNLYSDEELGENYSLLPDKLAEVITENPNIVAFLPNKYSPTASQVKKLEDKNIASSDFFFGREWIPTATPSPLFGMLPLILGTLLVSLVAVMIALPIGLGVAIYLSELANEKVRKVLKSVVELLAGIPSVAVARTAHLHGTVLMLQEQSCCVTACQACRLLCTGHGSRHMNE